MSVQPDFEAFVQRRAKERRPRDIDDFFTAEFHRLDERETDNDALWKRLIDLREWAASRCLAAAIYDRARERFTPKKFLANHDRRMAAMEPPVICRFVESAKGGE